MGRIYTKTGDGGMTGIHGGSRVPKEDIRIEANGTLDELNALLGIVRTMLPSPEHPWHTLLGGIQRNLMAAMSLVATPSAIRDANPNRLEGDPAAACETIIDTLNGEMGGSDWFILPGGTPLSARLHHARTVCRRAERRLWALHRVDPLPAGIPAFINRLSDLLFTLARYDLWLQEWPEERWQSFRYKQKRTLHPEDNAPQP